jgi:hypothetical protein
MMSKQTLVILVAGALLGACGYGKDTGPKAPKESIQFEPMVQRFVQKCQTCLDDVFQVSLGRPASAAERSDAAKLGAVYAAWKKELGQCLTGQGYGNEVQVEAQVVEVWLGHTGCPQFAAAAFKAPQCIAMQSVLEEAGYAPGAGGASATPPARPPAKTAPSGK